MKKKIKTYKTLCAFRKAIALLIPEKKHELILRNMEKCGYVSSHMEGLSKVYTLNGQPTADDVQVVVKRMGF